MGVELQITWLELLSVSHSRARPACHCPQAPICRHRSCSCRSRPNNLVKLSHVYEGLLDHTAVRAAEPVVQHTLDPLCTRVRHWAGRKINGGSETDSSHLNLKHPPTCSTTSANIPAGTAKTPCSPPPASPTTAGTPKSSASSTAATWSAKANGAGRGIGSGGLEANTID